MVLNYQLKDLYDNKTLAKIDEIFLAQLAAKNPNQHQKLITARLENKEDLELIIDLADFLEEFIGKLFYIEEALQLLKAKHEALANLYVCKKFFIQKRVLKTYNQTNTTQDFAHSYAFTTELDFANEVMLLLEDEEANAKILDKAAQYAAWAVLLQQHPDSILFNMAIKTDYEKLIATNCYQEGGLKHFTSPYQRLRDNFKLNDVKPSLAQALDEANYCIFCHKQNKDSCAKGLKEKDGSWKKNPLDIELIGCPLKQKISQMNYLKAHGFSIAALACAMIDNPMLLATGNRICNECMRSCIYQKQQPVDIPKIETRILNDVLELDWGFEIYSLFSRWNPLNVKQPLPLADTGYKVLVAGMGPAGFTLAHYLLNQGHTVVGIDGLKINPLHEDILRTPVKNVKKLYEQLDERFGDGFGGVVEYGITVRWDKNALKLIRLLLERRKNFALHSGIRFGSNINYDNAHALGFDHLALCLGAGKPNLPEIKNIMAKGVRTASDFLMCLHLSSPDKVNSLTAMQIRLPIVVIGAGLTAIDTATESICYYQRQVEKFLNHYEALVKTFGQDDVRKNWTKEEHAIAQEFISHAQMFKNTTDKIALIKELGGVKVLARGKLNKAASYRLNHQELAHALEEQIIFVEDVIPTEIIVDEYHQAQFIKCSNGQMIAAKTILIATGTSPNAVLGEEDPLHFPKSGKYFALRSLDEGTEEFFIDTGEINSKDERPRGEFNLYKEWKQSASECTSSTRSSTIVHHDEVEINYTLGISCLGDLHKKYSGSVVKAMASAKAAAPLINKLLHTKPPRFRENFLAEIASQLQATVVAVNDFSDNIFEIIVKAPLAAANFSPGQFYRLQNFAPPYIEPLALTGSSVDHDQISLIVIDVGASSHLARNLKVGEVVSLMGPTGTPTEIVANQNVMLVGGGLGNAVLFSIGKALRANGCKVLYFAGYREAKDRYKVEEIQAAADQIVWCCEGELLNITQAGDLTFQGNIIQAMLNYSKGEQKLPIASIKRIIAIGSDGMMNALQEARKSILKASLSADHQAIASINSPMQCMMKEICGQCLQQHQDPITGLTSYVYSCNMQDQNMDVVDFASLKDRLGQNSLQEKIYNMMC
jgi:NADPH-dependent glutamate synthase beta subunit-like oxidoreductase/NAD(P)H-flavin reductase